MRYPLKLTSVALLICITSASNIFIKEVNSMDDAWGERRHSISSGWGGWFQGLVCMAAIFSPNAFAQPDPAGQSNLRRNDLPKAPDNLQEDLLVSELSRIFGVTAQIQGSEGEQGGEVIVEGTANKVRGFIDAFSNVSTLQTQFIGIDSTIVSYPLINFYDTSCQSWPECAERIGITGFPSRLIRYTDTGVSIELPIQYESDKSIIYSQLDPIKKEIEVLNWFSGVSGFFQETEGSVIFRYDFINDFLVKPTMSLVEQVSVSEVGVFSEKMGKTSIPTKKLLGQIIVASGGNVYLAEGDAPGKYHVNTVLLGGYSLPKDTKPSLNIHFLIDQSDSMSQFGRMPEVNKQLPHILNLIQSLLPEGRLAEVTISTFNQGIFEISKFTLASDKPAPEFIPIDPHGLTNLNHIGKSLCSPDNSPDKEMQPGLLIAFSDGEHTYGELDKDLKEPQDCLSKNGVPYYPYLCRVAPGAKKDPYFSEIAENYGGYFNETATIPDFFEALESRLENLLQVKQPHFFKISALNGTIVRWTPASAEGIYSTGVQVSEGDTVDRKIVRRGNLRGRQE